MTWFRVLGSLLFVVALGAGAATATQRTSSFPVIVPCASAALSAAYSSAERVDSVQRFGCVGSWAYLWATIGSGVREVSVTELEHYDVKTNEWKNVPRQTYCTSRRLPSYVNYWGCHSN